MSSEILRIELDAGHPVTGPYDDDDEVAAAEVMAENVTELKAITIDEVREWASTNARAINVSIAIEGGTNDDIKNAAYIMDLILKSQGSFDPDNSDHVNLVNTLVPEVWGDDDLTDLIAKATKTTSRSGILALGLVRTGEVTRARAL